jgi:glycosyltransferase involved in cell wall biosynthesis
MLALFSCAGVPVIARSIGAELSQILGLETSVQIDKGSLLELDVQDKREQYSVSLRRAAMRQVVSESKKPSPHVSVVLPTRRPDFLSHALGQLKAQTYPSVEVVVVLHGDGFSATVDALVAEADLENVQLIRASEELTLGEVLNRGIASTSGEVVTKWDDDDWYAADHIWDLVLALEYSGADVVGKAAEFVYIAELDVTIRRFPDGVDSVSKTLAGGTLAARREVFDEVNGFPPMPRFVDQGLLARVVDAGGVPYRTHGLGYLLNRHGEHTWTIETDYFLNASFRQWRGLRVERAGCVATTKELAASALPNL